MPSSEPQSAAFVLAFRNATELFAQAGPMNQFQHAAWKELYRVVSNSEAGLDLLAELTKLREQVGRQQNNVAEENVSSVDTPQEKEIQNEPEGRTDQ